MAVTYKIRDCYPVQGEWFVVTNPEPERWFMSRVVLWGLVEAERSIDHIRAIDDLGHPHEDNDGDSYFAYGSDTSPLGPTWSEVYAAAPSRPRGSGREIPKID